MCGHVGVAGNLFQKQEKVFKTLLILDSLRGIDSTGVAVVSRKGDVKLAKSMGDPFRLMDTKRFDKAFFGFNCIAIGHNRYATQGGVNDTNAHPFEFDKIVGAHNGTLRNKHVLDDHKDFEVDSENLFHHMNRNGVEKTISILDGAWALVFFDKEDGTLNFIRNKERPFFYVYSEDNKNLYWASEKWMLSVALSREDVKTHEIQELEVDTHWRCEVYDDGTLGKPIVTPMKSKVEYKPQTGWNDHVQSNIRHLPTKETEKKTVTDTGNAGGAQSGDTKSTIFTPNPYKSGVEVALLVIGEGVDHHGSRYYICTDRHNPKEVIRLYRNAADRISLLNKEICACLHMFRYSDRGGAYHKVEYSSVRLANVDSPVESENEGAYQDANGKLIKLSEWNTKHGTCAWCTGHVDPSQSFKFTTSGEAICHLCAADEEVGQYVNFR